MGKIQDLKKSGRMKRLKNRNIPEAPKYGVEEAFSSDVGEEECISEFVLVF